MNSLNPSAAAIRRKALPLACGALVLAGSAAGFVLTVLLCGRDMVRRHLAWETERIPWVIFLKAGADRAALEEALQSLPGTRSLRFISREEAYDTVQADPAFAGALTLTGMNPFPESFEIRWDPAFLRGDFLDHATRQVLAYQGVEEIRADRPRMDRLALLDKHAGQLDLALLAALWAVGALAVLLLGRLLFFSSGPSSPGWLFSAAALGGAGGAAGAWLAREFTGFFSWRGPAAGAAAALLLALWGAAWRDS